MCRAYSRPDDAYRLLQPTFRLRRAGNPTGARDPRRDGDRNLLPFLHALSRLESASTRRAALRPFMSTPVPVPLGCPSLPDRDIDANAPPPPTCAGQSVVTIDVHGSVDRVKDVIRSNASGSSPSFSSACALFGACRCRSPPQRPQDTLCPRRVRRHGRKPVPTVDHRPRPVFRRSPAKDAAFPRTGVPYHRHLFHRGGCKTITRLRLSASASRSRRPHFFPRLGRVLNGALQAPRNGHPFPQRRLSTFGSANAFCARWDFRAWD